MLFFISFPPQPKRRRSPTIVQLPCQHHVFRQNDAPVCQSGKIHPHVHDMFFVYFNNPSLFGNKGMLLGNKDMLSNSSQNVWGGDGGDDSLGD